MSYEVGKYINHLNVCYNREYLLYNNGNINVKYLKKDIKYNISNEEVYTEVVEEKERFLDEDLDDKKKKDNKKLDKVKDDKKKVPGKKGEEVERKKEIYYES